MKKMTKDACCNSHKPLWLKLGILFPTISLLCGILVYGAPGLATWLLEQLTHSTWQFAIQPFNAVQFVTGLVAWAIIGAFVGWAVSKLCDCCNVE